MKRSNGMLKLALCLSALALATLATTASGAIVGTNSSLDAVLGRTYIPLSPATSGMLGTPLGGGNYVGLTGDKLTLTGLGATSSGYVTFPLSFALPGQISTLTTSLTLNLKDIDFKPQRIGGILYTEAVELVFLRDPGDTPTAESPVFRLDGSNYTTYGNFAGNSTFETNNRTVSYSINLRSDFGLSDEDFIDMNTDGDFALLVTLRSTSVQIVSGSTTLYNTPENLTNAFSFSAYAGGDDPGVPEPVTMGLLAAGSLALLRRRRA